MARAGVLGATALLLAGLSACTSDDSLNSEPQAPVAAQTDSNAIGFNVVARNPTRSSAIYNANNLPSQFYVSAWAMDSLASTNDFGNTYIKQDLIKNQGSAKSQNWVDQSGVRYWPNNGEELNFFASTSQAAALDYEESGQGASKQISNPKYIIPLTVNSAADQENDLLYATAYDQKKTATGAKGQTTQAVTLDFHHALSQVVFTAQCSNPHLSVKIGSISIAGIAGTGTLSIPADREASVAPAWTIASNYTPASFGSDPDGDQGAVTVGSAVTNITAAANQSQYALMMLPQTVVAADPSQTDPWSDRRAYLKVNCVIYNVAKGEGEADETVDTMVFGTNTDMGGGFIRTDYATLYIPISVDWQMGKRYVYNLQFGQGAGGYNQDGTNALIPIKYNITADSWVEAGTQSASPNV